MKMIGRTIFLLSMTMAFLTACSTPTVSSDDSDENSEKVEREDSSSSSNESKESLFNSNVDYGSMTDSRDGQVYRTVKIGEQIWMAENLNYATTDGSCCYDNSVDGCDKYGRFYIWSTAMGKAEDECGIGHECDLGSDNVQGVCPEGWHVPTKTEWETLYTTVGGQDNAGKALKSQTGWIDGGNGSDDYGFSALPAGLGHHDGNFYYEGKRAIFWIATVFSSDQGYNVYLGYGFDRAVFGNGYKEGAFSVRCVKD